MTARASLVSWLVALAAVLAAAAALGQTGTARSWDLPLAEVLAELRQGGSVIFLRHTATDYAESDARMKSYSDCGGQRNLAEKGRQDARNIGIAIRALGVPVGRVLSSPYCRTLETAELAFGRSEIATDVRSICDIRRLFTYNAQMALIVRAEADRVALAEKEIGRAHV